MAKIKREAMVGMDADMCNIPENIDHNYHIMAYRKDVTGEILGTVPSQPNLLITHKNSMYMSGYWDSSSSVLSWRLLNMGDGTDILTTTTSTTTTTTTTTTTPKPTQFIITGTFDVNLYYPRMVLVDLNGDEMGVDVEFKNPTSSEYSPAYGGYTVTTTFNPAGYKLRVSGRDAVLLGKGNYWAGEITLPNLMNWVYDQNTATYALMRVFTSSILTTTTTTTTSAAAAIYTYVLHVSGTSPDLLNLDARVSHLSEFTQEAFGTKFGSYWEFTWTSNQRLTYGWTVSFTGRDLNLQTHTASRLVTFIESTVDPMTLQQTITNITFNTGSGGGDIPTRETVAPFSLDKPEDTNSLDEAINDYLNEQ